MTLPAVGVEPLALDALPSMPAAAVRIVGLCDDPNVELGELASAVALDPALSARILRMANSAAYSRGHDVTTVERAMMLMGIKVVKLTALGFVVSSTLSDQMEHGSDLESQVWRQCLVKAVACRELAGLASVRGVQEAFLAGLFDGMGQLLGLLMRPAFGALIASQPFPTPDAEREVLGVTTSELVGAALRSWGVPDLYARILEAGEAASGPEATAFDETEVGRLAAVLVLARRATHQLLGHVGELGDAPMRAGRALGLDESALDTIAVDLGTHVTALAQTLDVDLGTEVDFPALLMHARTQMIETSMQIAQEAMQQTSRITSLEDQRDALRRDSLTDRLTGLPNRASFDDTLLACVDDRLSGRTVDGALGIAMIDIDHFKQFNDTYGHRIGDRVLSAVGAALGGVTRDGETMARYGGEEFVLIMPVVESVEALAAVVERVRDTVAHLHIDGDGLVLGVTVSVGAVAATRLVSADAAGSLTEAADRLLYQAKRAGRNCTRVDFIDATRPPVTDASRLPNERAGDRSKP